MESEIEKRIKALEKDSHPPVQDWDDLEERIAKLEKGMEWVYSAIDELRGYGVNPHK